jgi:hypothetical protein
MNEQSASERSRLSEASREYVEFLSELRISQPFASILLAMSNVILLGDLLYALAPSDSFIRQLTYLGLSTAVLELVANAQPILFYLLAANIVLLLLAPAVAVGCIGLAAMRRQKYRNGVFKQDYE